MHRGLLIWLCKSWFDFCFKKIQFEIPINKWQQEYSNIETYKYSIEYWVFLLVGLTDWNRSTVDGLCSLFRHMSISKYVMISLNYAFVIIFSHWFNLLQMKTENVKSVSYTHLDVYKRQEPHVQIQINFS